jgi:hypothetical protein
MHFNNSINLTVKLLMLGKLSVLLISIFLVSTFSVALHASNEGSREDILQTQKGLKFLGYDPGTLDGVFGRKTEQAIKNFQENAGLDIIGKLDDKTIAALLFMKTKLLELTGTWSFNVFPEGSSTVRGKKWGINVGSQNLLISNDDGLYRLKDVYLTDSNLAFKIKEREYSLVIQSKSCMSGTWVDPVVEIFTSVFKKNGVFIKPGEYMLGSGERAYSYNEIQEQNSGQKPWGIAYMQKTGVRDCLRLNFNAPIKIPKKY